MNSNIIGEVTVLFLFLGWAIKKAYGFGSFLFIILSFITGPIMVVILDTFGASLSEQAVFISWISSYLVISSLVYIFTNSDGIKRKFKRGGAKATEVVMARPLTTTLQSVNTTSENRLSRKQSSEKEDNSLAMAGLKGEDEVNFNLKFLPSEYRIWYDPDTLLVSGQLHQQFDHIVIGPKGIFLIETKYWAGDIFVDNMGAWHKEKSGKSEIQKSPTSQAIQHELVFKRLLIDNSLNELTNRVQSLIVLAHMQCTFKSEVIINIPVLRVDQLIEYILNYQNQQEELSSDYISKVLNAIIKNSIPINTKAEVKGL